MEAQRAALLAMSQEAQDFEPTKLEAPIINRDGVVELKFNQDLIVPSFLNTKNNNTGRLLAENSTSEVD